ncbi:MAG: hypothetical protein KUG77_08495 [Nannocystaceae bacterium]|nr:hypothetical protein [Nannocystaceae bacterium]
MTLPSTTLLGLVVSCSLLLFACDTSPGDVGESAESDTADSMPTTASDGGSSTGGDTWDGMPTTASGTGAGSTTNAGSDGMPTTASGSGAGSTTNADSQGMMTTGVETSSTGGTESDGMPTSGTGDGGPVPVDDCSDCEDGEVCLRFIALVAEHFCAPMPDECADDVDCECGADLCLSPFDSCFDPAEANTLDCTCDIC